MKVVVERAQPRNHRGQFASKRLTLADRELRLKLLLAPIPSSRRIRDRHYRVWMVGTILGMAAMYYLGAR